MTHPTDISPEDEALAAEYALGLLSPAEVTDFEVRLRREPVLFIWVMEWTAGFAALAEAEIDPVTPPRALQARIEATLFEDERPRTWSPLNIWRGLAAAGFASSIALATLLVVNTTPPAPAPGPVAPQPAFLAQLAPVTGEAQFVALYDVEAATLRVQQAAGTPVPQRAQELWLIVGDAAPVSLGLLAADGTTSIMVPAEIEAQLTQAVLAVSDEPLGGSPTGAPTGDVLAAGPIISL